MDLCLLLGLELFLQNLFTLYCGATATLAGGVIDYLSSVLIKDNERSGDATPLRGSIAFRGKELCSSTGLNTRGGARSIDPFMYFTSCSLYTCAQSPDGPPNRRDLLSATLWRLSGAAFHQHRGLLYQPRRPCSESQTRTHPPPHLVGD